MPVVTRPGKAVAAACVALVIVAAVLPLGMSLDWVVVPAAFVLLQAFPSSGTPVESLRCDARSVASVATIDSRGPPSLSLA